MPGIVLVWRLDCNQETYMSTTNTYVTKAADVEEKWYVIDAADQILGRVATQAAMLLRGKYNPKYTPSMSLGEHVIILNADKVRVTGKKGEQKEYIWHTGYMGGMRTEKLRHRMDRKPEEVLFEAVKGMIPRTKLGNAMLRKLRVYTGSEHNHQAQQPVLFELKNK